MKLESLHIDGTNRCSLQVDDWFRKNRLISFIHDFKVGEISRSAIYIYPDNKVHGANMGPIWGQQDPGGPHVGPISFAIWDVILGKDTWQYEQTCVANHKYID